MTPVGDIFSIRSLHRRATTITKLVVARHPSAAFSAIQHERCSAATAEISELPILESAHGTVHSKPRHPGELSLLRLHLTLQPSRKTGFTIRPLFLLYSYLQRIASFFGSPINVVLMQVAIMGWAR